MQDGTHLLLHKRLNSDRLMHASTNTILRIARDTSGTEALRNCLLDEFVYAYLAFETIRVHRDSKHYISRVRDSQSPSEIANIISVWHCAQGNFGAEITRCTQPRANTSSTSTCYRFVDPPLYYDYGLWAYSKVC